MGLFLIGGSTGNVFFNLAGPVLVNLYGWRFAFVSVASVGILSALILWQVGKEPVFLPERRKSNMLEVLQLFRYKIMWVCASIQFVRYSIMQSIAYWLPSLLINEKGFSLQFTGTIIAIGGAHRPFQRPGRLHFRPVENPTLVIGTSLVVLAITSSLIIIINNTALLILTIAVNAVFIQMYFGPLFSIPVEILGVRKAGISNGFGNMFANLGGLFSSLHSGGLEGPDLGFRLGLPLHCRNCADGPGADSGAEPHQKPGDSGRDQVSPDADLGLKSV